MIALRGLVVFPGSTVSFDVIRKASKNAVDKAMESDKKIFLSAQMDVLKENPSFLDIYKVGCVASVRQIFKNGDTMRVMVEVKERARLSELVSEKPYLSAQVDIISEGDEVENEVVNQAFIRSLQDLFEEYINVSKKMSPDKLAMIVPSNKLSRFADGIAANINCDYEVKQEILETLDIYARMEQLMLVLKNEIQISKEQMRIDQEVRKKIDENQREYYLREEMKVIEKELGDKEGYAEEIAKYREKIISLGFSKADEEKLLKETDRLSKMMSASPDGAVIRNYLDTVLELPWSELSEENLDIKNAAEVLDNDHYGLTDVKDRVLEHLAVHTLTGGQNGTVLCLVGPPGTGKTSVAASIARALGREFVRISLGGVHDEAEIRGHRRTYIGSMPGRIISAIKQAGTRNPVVLLDEIDKMGMDYKGDPSSALLEVLDFEQNSTFRDNYLEIPFDLSKVMFIATANNINNIPAPLLDRIETIEISGYTNIEKFEIAKRYLIPKQIAKNGLKGKRVTVADDAIEEIILYYTRESGVRGLERTIGKLLRKVAKTMLYSQKKSTRITKKNLSEYLGKHKYSFDKKNEQDEVGTVRGLAWTSVGGDTLSVEVNVMSGTGKVELTGNLGDVMKESCMTAVSFVRSKSKELMIKDDFYKTKDIHIHVPEGAVPKDGPSAGITIATAVASALTNTPVKADVAMTGEITLRGNVLAIGGLKEKSLAAYRAGIKTIIIPKENCKDIDEIPEEVKSKINFVPAIDMDTVLNTAFLRE